MATPSPRVGISPVDCPLRRPAALASVTSPTASVGDRGWGMRERLAVTPARTTDVADAAAVARRVLGLSRTATLQDTQRAYRLFASVTHPDHHDGASRAAAGFRTVRSAAAVLTDLQLSRTPDPHHLRALLDLPPPTPDPRIATVYCLPAPASATLDLAL